MERVHHFVTYAKIADVASLKDDINEALSIFGRICNYDLNDYAIEKIGGFTDGIVEHPAFAAVIQRLPSPHSSFGGYGSQAHLDLRKEEGNILRLTAYLGAAYPNISPAALFDAMVDCNFYPDDLWTKCQANIRQIEAITPLEWLRNFRNIEREASTPHRLYELAKEELDKTYRFLGWLQEQLNIERRKD